MQEGAFDVKIQRHRQKRSLSANALYWEMLGKLSERLRIAPDEIYRQHIREIGSYDVLCVQNEALESFSQCWTNGHLGRFVETRSSKLPGCTIVLAYHGSSDFDKGTMSRLVDLCLQDCRAVGIETWEEDKRDLLEE